MVDTEERSETSPKPRGEERRELSVHLYTTGRIVGQKMRRSCIPDEQRGRTDSAWGKN